MVSIHITGDLDFERETIHCLSLQVLVGVEVLADGDDVTLAGISLGHVRNRHQVGGTAKGFLRGVEIIRDRIDMDLSCGTMLIWRDESGTELRGT